MFYTEHKLRTFCVKIQCPNVTDGTCKYHQAKTVKTRKLTVTKSLYEARILDVLSKFLYKNVMAIKHDR